MTPGGHLFSDTIGHCWTAPIRDRIGSDYRRRRRRAVKCQQVALIRFVKSSLLDRYLKCVSTRSVPNSHINYLVLSRREYRLFPRKSIWHSIQRLSLLVFVNVQFCPPPSNPFHQCEFTFFSCWYRQNLIQFPFMAARTFVTWMQCGVRGQKGPNLQNDEGCARRDRSRNGIEFPGRLRPLQDDGGMNWMMVWMVAGWKAVLGCAFSCWKHWR